MGTAEATYAQHAVWFTEQAGAAGTAYHMAVGIRFGAGLDRRALAAACAAVVERHRVLGARVVTDDDGTPRLAPAAQRPALTSGALTDERVAAELARPYDLRDGPLARFVLLSAADDRHLLLATAHHLVFDGTSKDVLVRDLAAAYGQAVAGLPADLPPLPDPGHAAAERERVTGELPAARAHWQARPPGPDEVVLPGLRETPTRAEPGASVDLDLPADLVAGVDRAARDIGVTRFELLLCAVHALLHRYGNRDAAVGVALSTRTPDQGDLVGLFVNELPVRVAPPTGPLRAYAHAVRRELRALNRFRAVPLSHAVPGLRPAPAITPVSVGYRRRGAEPTFAGVSSQVDWTVFGGSARNALHVQVVDSPTGLTVSLQHSPRAVDPDSVVRIGAHLRTVLAAAVADPDRDVADLPLLPAAEQDRVRRAGHGPERAYPFGGGVPGLVAARVRAEPTAVAVVDGDRTLTYADLDAAGARLAGLLRQRGVTPGTRVAVALDRSWQAVVTLLAVLRCRAAYVPVDPQHPAARQDLVLADADPTLVVATPAVAARLGTARPVLDLTAVPDLTGPAPGDADGSRADADRTPGDAEPYHPDRTDAGPDPAAPADVAYVLYTSGSTGRPKGVAVRHDSLVNLLCALRDLFDSRPAHRWLHLTSLAFDISGVELWLPLVTGGRVVVASGVSALDGAGVLRLVQDAGVTHAQATPSGWRVLLEAGLGPGPLVAVTGGEALPPTLARELRARVGRLFNGYGPTEATIYATMAEIPPDPDGVSIGRPLANVRVHLLDDRLRPVPVGVPGELCLAGVSLAAGYLDAPELTADRFVPDPFGRPDERIYRTGDRARWLPDGRIEFLGRDDDQVKIRGHRVEPGEVTARLLEHPTVADAVVAGVDDGDGTRLVAWVVARGAATPEPTPLRQHLSLTLPPVMVPADWVFLDRLPVGPSGKVDRSALPPPAPRAEHPPQAAPAGDDPVVEQLRLIWQEVLKVPDIGVHEDLFDLGGHSLSVTRISGRIQQRLGVEVPLDAFFDTPTIAEIADIVRRSGKEF